MPSLLGDGVATSELLLALHDGSETAADALSPLTPDEAEQVRHAREKRQLEYRAGRHCVRAAL